jgi:riboflavin kinase/FMN adenylyltransferase
MEVLEGLAALDQLPPGSVMSIGNFDGMHRGHRKLLATCAELKLSTHASATVIVTFEPHPLTVLRPEHAPPRLTLPSRKRDLLAEAGVDILIILPPGPDVLDLSAERFWEMLRDRARPAHLVEGGSFNFGKNRGGTIDKLREWSAGTTVQLHVVICLGRAYELNGRVVEGAKRGRELGVPTANLDCPDQLIPADGVYAGRCAVGGRHWPAAVSIGTNPTFGNNPRTIEAHLIGFSGNLYGQSLRLELLDWQRDQQIYNNIEALKHRIARDIEQTLSRNQIDPARPLTTLEC